MQQEFLPSAVTPTVQLSPVDHVLIAPSEQQTETGPQSMSTLLPHIPLVKPWKKSYLVSSKSHWPRRSLSPLPALAKHPQSVLHKTYFFLPITSTTMLTNQSYRGTQHIHPRHQKWCRNLTEHRPFIKSCSQNLKIQTLNLLMWNSSFETSLSEIWHARGSVNEHSAVWVMMSYGWVWNYRCFKVACSEPGYSMFFWRVGTHLPNHVVSQLRAA